MPHDFAFQADVDGGLIGGASGEISRFLGGGRVRRCPVRQETVLKVSLLRSRLHIIYSVVYLGMFIYLQILAGSVSGSISYNFDRTALSAKFRGLDYPCVG